MDSFFSLKGKDAMLISGLIGVVIYFAFMDGEDSQNKFYYIALGYGAWIIMKNIYWALKTSKIINISNYDLNRANAELEKIRKHDEDRADRIEAMF